MKMETMIFQYNILIQQKCTCIYPDYFDKYIETLVLNGKVDKAIEKIKFFNSKIKLTISENSLLTVSAIKNSDFDSATLIIKYG